MNRYPDSKKPINKLKRTGAMAAMTLVAAVSPAVASGETPHVPKLKKHIATRILERQTEEKLRKGFPVLEAFATFRYRNSTQPGGTKYAPDNGGGLQYDSAGLKYNKQIGQPFAVFRGNPKEMGEHSDLLNGDYAFGSLDLTSGKPVVKLHPFDRQTMDLAANDGRGIFMQNFILQTEYGTYGTGLNWDGRQIEYDLARSSPFRDPNGHPYPVAEEYDPKK